MQLNEIMQKKGPREERVTRAMTEYIVEKFIFDARESFKSEERILGQMFAGETEEEWIRYNMLKMQIMSYIGEPLDEAVDRAWNKLAEKYKPLTDQERRKLTKKQYQTAEEHPQHHGEIF